MTKLKLQKHQGSSMTRFTLLMFLMFGMSTSVLAMEDSDPNAMEEGNVHWQAEDRLQVVVEDGTRVDRVESRALGSAVVEVVADMLDSPGVAALLGSSGAIATILRHTPAYAKQRQRRWYDDLARELERATRERAELERARLSGVGLVVDIDIVHSDIWASRSPRTLLPAPHNRLSLAWDRPKDVPKVSWWRSICRRRAHAEQEETYTTKETLTNVIRGPVDEMIETHSPSDPSVTVSRSTLVEALFITFNQYGTLELTLSWMPNDMPHFILTIAVATGVDEVKAQQLMNKLVDRLTKKQIII